MRMQQQSVIKQRYAMVLSLKYVLLMFTTMQQESLHGIYTLYKLKETCSFKAYNSRSAIATVMVFASLVLSFDKSLHTFWTLLTK